MKVQNNNNKLYLSTAGSHWLVSWGLIFINYAADFTRVTFLTRGWSCRQIASQLRNKQREMELTSSTGAKIPSNNPTNDIILFSNRHPRLSSAQTSNPSKDTSCVIRRLTTINLPTFVGWICLGTVASVASVERKPSSSQLLLYASLFRYMCVSQSGSWLARQYNYCGINPCNSCLVLYRER